MRIVDLFENDPEFDWQNEVEEKIFKRVRNVIQRGNYSSRKYVGLDPVSIAADAKSIQGTTGGSQGDAIDIAIQKAVDKKQAKPTRKSAPKTSAPAQPKQQKSQADPKLRRGSDDRVLRHQRFYNEPEWSPKSKIGKAVKKVIDPVKKGVDFVKRRQRSISAKSKYSKR